VSCRGPLAGDFFAFPLAGATSAAGCVPSTKSRATASSLLELHHDRIQRLFNKNQNVSRQELGPQIHGISDQTHHEIEELLTKHQKELAKAMQERMHR
jgi:hypothetical protein